MIEGPKLKTFKQVKYYCDKWRKDTDNEMWMVQQENGLRQWVNEHDTDGTMKRISDYDELKEKIQNKLRQMGYTIVSEIPPSIIITFMA